jgi:hypothetical protein
MDATQSAFMLLAIGILVAHLATLRFLMRCKDLMPAAVDGSLADRLHPITEGLADLCGTHSGVNEGIMEVCRIGADLADALESMPAGGVAGKATPSTGGESVQATIMQLMLDRFLGGLNGNQTQQEWAVHQEQAQTNHDDPQNDPEPSPQ